MPRFMNTPLICMSYLLTQRAAHAVIANRASSVRSRPCCDRSFGARIALDTAYTPSIQFIFSLITILDWVKHDQRAIFHMEEAP